MLLLQRKLIEPLANLAEFRCVAPLYVKCMGLELRSAQCEVCPLNKRLLTQFCNKVYVASKICFINNDCKSTVTNKATLRNTGLISDVFNKHTERNVK